MYSAHYPKLVQTLKDMSNEKTRIILGFGTSESHKTKNTCEASSVSCFLSSDTSKKGAISTNRISGTFFELENDREEAKEQGGGVLYDAFESRLCTYPS